MASIFTKIVNGDIPCYKIAEDDRHLAFLDIRPMHEGHTLVIPKKEIDYYFDLEAEEYAALNAFALHIAKALKKAIPCFKVAQLVIGDEVPHAHIHLVPFQTARDLRIGNSIPTSPEFFEATAEKIKAQL